MLLAVALLGGGLTESAGAQATKAPPGNRQAVDFDRDIRPVLANACNDCHGPSKQKGGLRLDVKAPALAGGTSGQAILPGKGNDSSLVHRLKGLGDEDRMPLKKDPLSAEQIDLITRWIDQGAKWPDDGAVAKASTHWSFIKPVRPELPKVEDAGWVRNPIDAFVLATLEKEGIRPSPEAPRETLLRRLSLDLTGLPPTPEEIDAFLADTSPDAYERQVDRLLASPHYGERWGKHWLDEARYADSNGYSIDSPRQIWKYRDWVIDALNRDMPFDQFATEQLAGDLLPGATTDQKIATGFHRNTQINEEGGIDPEQFRVEAVLDRVNTTGTVFLGLTIGCAQCHNHKFDPLPQKDYYRLFAFFNNQDEPTLELASPENAKLRADLLDKIRVLEIEIHTAGEGKQGSDGKPDKAVAKKKAELAALKKKEAALGVTTMVLAEREKPRESFVFIKGDFTRHGEPVSPGTPGMLPPFHPANPDRPTRLDLARWITDPENPLTARVTVNRLWLQYFGRGLVETDNDFGTQGSPPTHPELLDWLATELVRLHWSLKAIHRLIVTSATYRQSSHARPELQNTDPYNKLLARQSRVRLDAEVVRDVGLCASGLLCDKIGGPSVFPPQPEGVMGLGQVKREWKVSSAPDCYRRGLYTFLWRANPHPLLTSFDAPDGINTCTRRLRSNTPLQSLTLLNDAAFVEFAQALAGRVVKETDSDEGRIDCAFRLAMGRKPADDEREILLKLLSREADAFEQDPAHARDVAGGKAPAGVDPPQFAAWVIVCRTVLNLDETITRE